jgi:RNA polymerase sigma factor (sigma-70 family)
MANADLAAVGRHLHLLIEAGTVTGLCDRNLLEMYVSRHDELAFTALLERHGPMVQRVCHEILADHHDAQDAFQATFLVLAQAAGSIRQRDSLASWLYGVALRVAAGARAARARRREHERTWATLHVAATEAGAENHDELCVLLHEEISGLPERFRAPVVLCHLEGRTYDEAAQVLRCPVGTIKSRLSTARERLRRRLERRNRIVAASAESAGLVLKHGLPITTLRTRLPARLLQAVIRGAEGGPVPAAISRLARGVLKTMLWQRLVYRLAVAAVMLVGTAALSTGAIALTAMNCDLPGDGGQEVPASAPSVAQPPPVPHDETVQGRQAPLRRGPPITLRGRVVDEQGGGVTGAQVRVRLFWSHRKRNTQPIALTTREVKVRFFRIMQQGIRMDSEELGAWEIATDAQGRYHIDGVRGIEGNDDQHFAIDVNSPGFVEFVDLPFEYLDRVAKANGALADVRLQRGDAVTGRCVGPDGKAVPGAKIRLAVAEKPLSSLGRLRTTDAEGRFRLAIPHGQAAELIVYPTKLAPRRVSVAAGRGDLGDVRLEAGVELSGDLTVPIGLMSDEQAKAFSAHKGALGGLPFPGKVIALESTEPGAFDWFPITLACKTDRDGKFRIAALQGTFKIWVAQAHDSGPDDRGPIVSDGPPPPVLPMVVSCNTDTAGPARALFVPLIAFWPPVTIRGTITGPDGRKAEGISLDLSVALEGAKADSLTPLEWTTTDAEGRYAFPGIPRGLAHAYLTVHPAPPGDRSRVAIAASGNFRGKVVGSTVSFEPLDQDQDPLDLRLKIETVEPPAQEGGTDHGRKLPRTANELSLELNALPLGVQALSR